MVLEFSDWLFLVDVDTAKSITLQDAQDRCCCACCKNYYQTVDKAYPNLRYFLSRFGLDVEAPEALLSITGDMYQATYIGHGRILRYGSEPIYVDELPITIDDGADENTFLLDTGLMELPWVLNEDKNTPSDVFSDIFKPFKDKKNHSR